MGRIWGLPTVSPQSLRGPPIPSTYFLGSGSGHGTDFRVPENVFRATDHFWGLRYVLQRSESVECRGNGTKEKRETKVRTHKHYSLETLGKRARSILISSTFLSLPLLPFSVHCGCHSKKGDEKKDVLKTHVLISDF